MGSEHLVYKCWEADSKLMEESDLPHANGLQEEITSHAPIRFSIFTLKEWEFYITEKKEECEPESIKRRAVSKHHPEPSSRRLSSCQRVRGGHPLASQQDPAGLGYQLVGEACCSAG